MKTGEVWIAKNKTCRNITVKTYLNVMDLQNASLLLVMILQGHLPLYGTIPTGPIGTGASTLNP